MNYKIVSQNKAIINKAEEVFVLLRFRKSIHVQDVDFELVDFRDLSQNAIKLYKNRIKIINTLFIVNDNKDIKTCLENGFLHYIHADFSKKELALWGQNFFKKSPQKILYLSNNSVLDFSKSLIIQKNKPIKLSKQEAYLLKILSDGSFTSTQNLQNKLRLNSPISVRTIVNRIRKKIKKDIFVSQKGLGYRLDLSTRDLSKDEALLSYMKELQEQNQLMQSIVDNSPIFIATFIHKDLFCINNSFREFLGRELVKRLWEEGEGDFWLIFEKPRNVFNVGLHKTKTRKNVVFEINTFYFPTQDKHFLFFVRKGHQENLEKD